MRESSVSSNESPKIRLALKIPKYCRPAVTKKHSINLLSHYDLASIRFGEDECQAIFVRTGWQPGFLVCWKLWRSREIVKKGSDKPNLSIDGDLRLRAPIFQVDAWSRVSSPLATFPRITCSKVIAALSGRF